MSRSADAAPSDAALSDAALSDAALSDAALSDVSIIDVAPSDVALSDAAPRDIALSAASRFSDAMVGDSLRLVIGAVISLCLVVNQCCMVQQRRGFRDLVGAAG
jgi:hypothetical protein